MMTRRHCFRNWLSILLDLCKVQISLMVSMSTATGFILFRGDFSFNVFVPVLGVFFLSCGSCALNQIQERNIDALMSRTRMRPLPSKRMTPKFALWISIVLIALGIAIFYIGSNSTALLLGLFTVLWYNAVYTPLKKLTIFAVFVGALIGAIPPSLGWVAAGGALSEPIVLILALFFFVWQIPHFWLLALVSGQDYQRAGLPTLVSLTSKRHVALLAFFGILITSIVALLLPVFGGSHVLAMYSILAFAVLWFLGNSIKLLSTSVHDAVLRLAFRNINIFALLVMAALILDKIL